MNHSDIFASNIGISQQEVDSLLSMSRSQIYASEDYQALVSTLDYDLLANTLDQVRSAYDTHLPEVVDYLRTSHNFGGNPMTSTTLGNWILGFLHNPNYLSKLPDFHKKVPVDILEAGLPHILEILDGVGDSGTEWKKALALLSLPFFTN